MLFVGFRPSHPRLYRVYNFIAATSLLVAATPVLLVLTVCLFATQGTSVFYRGPRLGRGQRVFQIIKFRTLCNTRAAALTRDRTLPSDACIFTPLGEFLRDTRLDELPQLVNVLMGDMNICGPRPVRPEIRNCCVGTVPGYDDRFSVKPGLLGPAQACFGHGASKTLRARMNNAAVRRPVCLAAEIALSVVIMWSMLVRVLTRVLCRTVPSLRKRRSRIQDRRVLAGGGLSESLIRRIDRKCLETEAPVDLTEEHSVVVRLKSGGLRRARVRIHARHIPGAYSYAPVTDYAAHIIERYALEKVVVPPAVGRIAPTIRSNSPRIAVGDRVGA
ncbi:MAG: sugar transferase [Pseudomonadota bacterium]